MTAPTMDPATEGGRRRGSRPCRWILRRRETGGGDHDPDDGSGDGGRQEAGMTTPTMDPATEGTRRRRRIRRRPVTAPRAPSLRLPPSLARPRRLPPAVGSGSDWGWVSRGRVAPYRGRG